MRRFECASMASSIESPMHMDSVRRLCSPGLAISTSRDKGATSTPEMCSALECSCGWIYRDGGCGGGQSEFSSGTVDDPKRHNQLPGYAVCNSRTGVFRNRRYGPTAFPSTLCEMALTPALAEQIVGRLPRRQYPRRQRSYHLGSPSISFLQKRHGVLGRLRTNFRASLSSFPPFCHWAVSRGCAIRARTAK
jgi:hypothetical protein